MKILITGCKGQLGSQLINILRNGKSELGDIPKELINAEVTGIDIENLDISDLYETRKVIGEIRPDIVINPAAYTNVDGCETNEDVAFKVNSIGPRNIAIACEEIGLNSYTFLRIMYSAERVQSLLENMTYRHL